MSMVVQILMACVGSLGFAIMYHLPIPRFPLAAASGGVVWAVFLAAEALGADMFVANLVAAFVAAVYSHMMARIQKAPATVFLVGAVIPLIPGGRLYYTMEALVAGNRLEFLSNATMTALIAGGIAFGLLVFAALNQIVRNLKKARKYKGFKR